MRSDSPRERGPAARPGRGQSHAVDLPSCGDAVAMPEPNVSPAADANARGTRQRRVFLGLTIAPAITDELAALARRLDYDDVRRVAAADIHLTLVPPWNAVSIADAVDRLRDAIGEIGPFHLSFDHVGYGPQPRRCRLLWVQCTPNAELSRLQMALARAFPSADRRPFRPHVTLARLRRNGPAIARKFPIDMALALSQQVASVELFQSPPAGERGYRVLASVPLGAAAKRAAAPKAANDDVIGAPNGSTMPQTVRPVRLFLCGDVMTGRGVDQVLPSPCDPALHESHVKSALDYVALAEVVNGPIARPAGVSSIWGAALGELDRARPDLRIVNLETSITRSDNYEPKGINYRMSPENAGCLTAAELDCCVLANNHVLDWGPAGLLDTLARLEQLGIKHAGAGRDQAEAVAPATFAVAGAARVVVHAFAATTSGVPPHWAAAPGRPGVNLLPDLSAATVARVLDRIAHARRPGDITIASIHWGANWGYEVPEEQVGFAHALIDGAAVSVVHGHSSHHAKGLEVHGNRLILYGCGDFLNDYEGIMGYEAYRDDLPLMYFADIDPASGELVALEMVPLQIRRFRLTPASGGDAQWLAAALNRASRPFGARIDLAPDGRLRLRRNGAVRGGSRPAPF